jgi:hypothetical protein
MTQPIYAPDYFRYIQALEKRITNIERASFRSDNKNWKTIASSAARIDWTVPASGTWIPVSGSTPGFIQSGVNFQGTPQGVIYLRESDYTIDSIAPKLRIVTALCTNSTDPGVITIQSGLTEITASAGAAGNSAYTFSSTPDTYSEIVDPDLSTINYAVSTEINFPTEGLYAMTYYTSVTSPGYMQYNSYLQVNTG